MATTWVDLGIDVAPRGGWQKTTCPWCSHTRRNRRERCLSANDDIGYYRCHHCGRQGWLSERDWRERIAVTTRRKTYSPPSAPPRDLHPDALAWFAARGIPEAVVRRNRITATASSIAFPYLRDGAHVNTKHRRFPDKGFRMEKDAELCLYGLDDLGDVDTVTFVEGELDKLAIEAATGMLNVVSVPNGATKEGSLPALDYLESAQPVLDRMTRIVLAGDADAAGRALTEELARRLGRHRIWTVDWPDCKDANETLIECGADVVAACLADARPFPLDGVIRPIDLYDRVLALRDRVDTAALPGWPSLDRLYRIGEGMLTVVSGVPSSGKSAFLNAMLVNVARNHGWRFGLCSPETWPPEEHARDLAEVYAGAPLIAPKTPLLRGEDRGPRPMTDDEVLAALTWVNDHFTFIAPEPISVEAILERAAAVHLREGLNGLVVDPWNRLGHAIPSGMSETQYIGRVLDRLQAFGHAHGMHVWVVAHPTKMQPPPPDPRAPEAKRKMPVVRPYDIAGSSNFYNMADNILSVWRDKEDPFAPVTIHVQKVRFRRHGELGAANLFFDPLTGRYRE